MLLTTTNNIEGKRITQYYGIVTGETIIGANVFRDFMAGIRDFFGGRTQEADARGANAVIGIDLDYETVGESGSMLMVTASGTAVRVE